MGCEVMIVTGPSGGHFFPGLALAEKLAKKSVRVTFAVPPRKTILDWLEEKKFDWVCFPEARLSKKTCLVFPFRFLYALTRSTRAVLRENPRVVVATGSYTSVPGVIAAKICRRRVILHEQNFLAGKATRLLSTWADAIALTFPGTPDLPAEKIRITGCPIPEAFSVRHPREKVAREFGLAPDRTTLLVMGGSQAAEFINRLMEKHVPVLAARKLQVIHLAGRDRDRLAKVYRDAGVSACVRSFCYDMGRVYSLADLAVCRAGAGTLAELSDRQIPALLIPYPHAGAHQMKNARHMEQFDLWPVLQQDQHAIDRFPAAFSDLLNRLPALKRNVRKEGIADTDDAFCALTMEHLRHASSTNHTR